MSLEIGDFVRTIVKHNGKIGFASENYDSNIGVIVDIVNNDPYDNDGYKVFFPYRRTKSFKLDSVYTGASNLKKAIPSISKTRNTRLFKFVDTMKPPLEYRKEGYAFLPISGCRSK